MIYDTIIIGAGAAGLYAAAHSEKQNGLIFYKGKEAGMKLLMSGAGQCNLTHGGDIKDFYKHYGDNGKKIRSVLYKHNNEAVKAYFEERNIPLFERADGKVFPKSLEARDIRDTLLKEATQNGFKCVAGDVTDIKQREDGKYEVYVGSCEGGRGISEASSDTNCHCRAKFICKKVIIATGGCSYAGTGSDGKMFEILDNLGISITERKPALVPIFIHEYPYSELSGTSFQDVEIRCDAKTMRDALLFTHKNISGPAVLNLSRWLKQGDKISINYLPEKNNLLAELKETQRGNSKQIVTVLTDLSEEITKNFAKSILGRAEIEAEKKISTLTGEELKRIVKFLTNDEFTITGLGSYNIAMATNGGINLAEVSIPSMELKKYPNMFAIGEVLDVDGDTGGYNLQFAFSSGYQGAKN